MSSPHIPPGPGPDGRPDRRPDLSERAYERLHELAAARLREERVGHTLDPTALLHEAWIRMRGVDLPSDGGPTRFQGLAARILRQVLVDHARRRAAAKRGGGADRVEGEDLLVASGGLETSVLDLEGALERLAERAPRQARVVELRFFGGLTSAEAAGELGVSEDTVKRDWRLARAWLNRDLRGGAAGAGE